MCDSGGMDDCCSQDYCNGVGLIRIWNRDTIGPQVEGSTVIIGIVMQICHASYRV